MRTKLFIFSVLLFLVSCGTVRTGNENTSQIFRQIDSADCKILFHYAYPFRMQAVPLTSDYRLQISGDSAFANLPYFGVAHVAPVNPSEGGIRFGAAMQDYKVKTDKKMESRVITFNVKSGMNEYRLTLQIYDNGKARLNVSDSQRDPISFVGEMQL